MKGVIGWGLTFVVALVFAILVDKGVTHLGIPDYIWLAVNFTLFFYLLARFVGRPIMAYLETRRQGIGEELERARQQLVEGDNLRAEVERRLAGVEAEIGALGLRAADDSREEAARIAEQTRRDEERFLRRVEDEIARREVETRTQLARDTATLTAQLARELLHQEMSDEDRRRVFERSLDAMGALEAKE
jgi:F-type H+-transporting ATPase subunit b